MNRCSVASPSSWHENVTAFVVKYNVSLWDWAVSVFLPLSQSHTETHSLGFTDSRRKPQVCVCVYVAVSLCVSELLGNSFLFWRLCSFDCNFTTPCLKQLELFHLRSLGRSLYAGTINLRHADEKQQKYCIKHVIF